jgi:hypothetical protein
MAVVAVVKYTNSALDILVLVAKKPPVAGVADNKIVIT